MRNRLTVIVKTILIGVLLMGASELSARAQGSMDAQHDLPVSEEIRRSFQLAPGARINVSTISGPVDIENAGPSHQAEVYIVRSAQTQRELDCYRTVVEQTAAGLTIRHTQTCRNVRSRQRVHLTVPHDANIRLESISGDVHIGEIGGQIRLESISGGVWINQVIGDVNISSVSGQVNLDIATVRSSLRLSSISGQIFLRFAEGVNADVRAESIAGDISSEMPGVTVEKVGDSDYRAQIGRGGAPINISSVSGQITLRNSKPF